MLSENIKTIRKSKGLSQEELAVKLNVDFDEDEELFEDEDDLTAFDSEEEIFEEEDEQPPVGEEKAAEADTSGKEETADEKEDEKTIEKEV